MHDGLYCKIIFQLFFDFVQVDLTCVMIHSFARKWFVVVDMIRQLLLNSLPLLWIIFWNQNKGFLIPTFDTFEELIAPSTKFLIVHATLGVDVVHICLYSSYKSKCHKKISRQITRDNGWKFYSYQPKMWPDH